MTQPCDAVVTSLASNLGVVAEGVWAAPGRVNLIGEHTDYNGGLCLPIALPQRTWVAARRRPDDLVRMVSIDFDDRSEIDLGEVAPNHPDGWAGYVAGPLWALREAGYKVHGLDVAITSTVPIGAGLSSSAAIEGAVAGAAADLFDLGLLGDPDSPDSDAGRAILAKICRRAENHIVGAPTGGLDQTASLRTRAGHALLIDFGHDARISQIRFDLASHNLALVVIDTHARHALVDGQYGARRASCEQAAELLSVANLGLLDLAELDYSLAQLPDDVLRRRVHHVVTEIARVRATCSALEVDDFEAVGKLFDASHASLRDDYQVSCPELDVACQAALSAGALGARMTGGGFGGSAIALAPAATVDAIEHAVLHAYAEQGWAAPTCFVALAAGPASRVS